jgi:hypothetical protein
VFIHTTGAERRVAIVEVLGKLLDEFVRTRGMAAQTADASFEI